MHPVGRGLPPEVYVFTEYMLLFTLDTELNAGFNSKRQTRSK